MDKLEQTVENERRGAESQRSGYSDVPEDAGLDHPTLRAAHDKMLKSHQRRMQQLADKERELDRQWHQLSATASMAQHQAAGPVGNGSAESNEYDWVDDEVKPLLQAPDSAPLRALVRSFDKRVKSSSSNPQLTQMQETINALQAQLQQTQSAFTQEKYMRQIPDFRKKYGQHLDEDVQQSVLQEALSRGIDLERALFAVSPETALAQMRSSMEAEIKQKYASEYGASLEGMEDIVASQPQTNQNPFDKSTGKLRPFRETALNELGKGGMVRAMREGFAREEAVSDSEE